MAQLLTTGAPAWGERSDTTAGLKVGWKRGRGKGFKLKRYWRAKTIEFYSWFC